MGISSASRVFINGDQVAVNGQVGIDVATSHSKELPFSVNAIAKAGNIGLVVQVSNFDFIDRGGIVFLLWERR